VHAVETEERQDGQVQSEHCEFEHTLGVLESPKGVKQRGIDNAMFDCGNRPTAGKGPSGW
jgi:hypothetical protein